jgi:hypothetical protein
MGHGITPYAVPMAKLRSACGSKRKTLVAAVRRDCADLVLDLDQSFADEIARGAPDAETALAALVDWVFDAKPSDTFMCSCMHMVSSSSAPT